MAIFAIRATFFDIDISYIHVMGKILMRGEHINYRTSILYFIRMFNFGFLALRVLDSDLPKIQRGKTLATLFKTLK